MNKRFLCAAAAVLAVAVGGGYSQTATGTFTDKRDNKRYRTVTIGGQTWMAENLNYAVAEGSGSWCYDNSPDSCAKYGRLYNWETALTACPAGWRLPSNGDWYALIETAGGRDSAGTKLKSKIGWRKDERYIAGTDDFGFSAMPGGDGSLYRFSMTGSAGCWWSATKLRQDNVQIYIMYYSREDVGNDVTKGLSNGNSVRCVRK